MNKAGSTDPLKVALALEDLSLKDFLDGPETTMRKDDHQIADAVLVGAFRKGVKYDSASTGLGWKTEVTVPAKDLDQPNTCKMKRPANRTSSAPRRRRGIRSRSMEIFLVSLFNGLVYGMLLFMLASGLTLILSMMGVLNFAHASVYMLGAYFAYTHQPLHRLLAGPGHGAGAVRAGRRGDRDVGAAARPSERPHRRAAVHLRPRLHHREGGADDLGPAAGALPRAAGCSTCRYSASTARNFRPIAPSCC